MATTPEGAVKKRVRAVLDKYEGRIYYIMPVPGGYGKSTLDFICCFMGYFFAIETKAGKKSPTERQEGIIEDIIVAGGSVFRINDETGVTELEVWLDRLDRR